MADNSVFDLPLEAPSDEEPTAEAVVEEEVAAESPAPEVAPVEEPVAAPEAEAPQAEEEPTEDVEPAVPEAVEALNKEAARRWANKYDSPEDLERGYSESREMWRRANEARKAEGQRAMEAEERERTLMARIQAEIVPTLQQAAAREEQMRAFAEQYRQQYGEYPQGLQPPAAPVQPEVTPQTVEQVVEQRLAQERQSMQASWEAEQERQAQIQAVNGFYEAHPEVEIEGPIDTELKDTVMALNESWDRIGLEVDIADRPTLEIVYEATKRPALLEILRMRPEYFDSPYGMELARRDAAVLEGVPATTGPVTQSVPASQVKTSGQRKPFAESAATGANVPDNGADQNDPWARIQASSQGPTTPGGNKPSLFFE